MSLDVGKIIQRGRLDKKLTQKELATVSGILIWEFVKPLKQWLCLFWFSNIPLHHFHYHLGLGTVVAEIRAVVHVWEIVQFSMFMVLSIIIILYVVVNS